MEELNKKLDVLNKKVWNWIINIIFIIAFFCFCLSIPTYVMLLFLVNDAEKKNETLGNIERNIDNMNSSFKKLNDTMKKQQIILKEINYSIDKIHKVPF